MSTAPFRSVPVVSQAVHWAACVLGTLAVLTFALFAVGLGLLPLAALNASFAAVAVMLVGFLLTWWKDWLGGLISLVGLGWFQAIEIAANGHPAGGLFPLLVVPGVLGLLAALVRRKAGEDLPLEHNAQK